MKYAVINIETCRVPKSLRTGEYRWSHETIQIGAVLLDEDLNMVKKFSTFVRPQYGRMDPFVEYITGIKKENVEAADTFEAAIDRFVRWLKDYDVRCVSWSYSDENQIRREVAAKGINNPRINELLDSWIDCQKIFDEKMDFDRPLSLEEALAASDIYAGGSTRDSLVDAYNTAILFKKLGSMNFRLAAG
ncbi:MAG: exonuclease domain-containing protein [Lachnospiraceae bacterium]|nr:exonuclease domain-containing protein [Lachnospiraceae bacterium]MBR6485322.1 exonuclease domain-containing protein [Lachnospiraceae bacterium]